MRYDVYQPPKSELITKKDCDQKNKIFWFRWCLFSILLIIGIIGILLTIRGLLIFSDRFFFTATGLFLCVAVTQSMRIIFSNEGKKISRLMDIFKVILFLFLILFVFCFILYTWFIVANAMTAIKH